MFDLYNDMVESFEKTTDQRLSGYFLLSPGHFFLSLIAYYLLVTKILPKYMESRQPYNLKNVLIVYNAVQVVLSAYLFYTNTRSWVVMDANFFKCNPVDKSDSLIAKEAIIALYLYFLSKYTEFIDTIFFVLRKKFNQVSFLHIYHHISTPIFCWFGLKYYPGGSFIFLVMLNAFVHIIMYAYYMLAAVGPHMQKYLWWKKYLTSLQLIQFVTGMTHVAFAIIMSDSECNIPRKILGTYLAGGAIFYLLFSHFYKNAYGKKKTDK